MGEKAAMLQRQLNEAEDDRSQLQKQAERLGKERHALKKALDKVHHTLTLLLVTSKQEDWCNYRTILK